MVIAVDDIVARGRSALGEHTPMLTVRDVLVPGNDVINRSEWDVDAYEERPRDFERTCRLLEAANDRCRAER